MIRLASWIALVLRFIFGGMLVWAGWEKLQAFGWWREILGNMQVLPDVAVGPLAAALPGIEVVLGCALVIGLWTRASASGAALLFLIFAAFMANVIFRDIDTVCGCFGPDSEYPVTMAKGLQSLSFGMLCASIPLLPGSKLSVDSHLDGSAS